MLIGLVVVVYSNYFLSLYLPNLSATGGNRPSSADASDLLSTESSEGAV